LIYPDASTGIEGYSALKKQIKFAEISLCREIYRVKEQQLE
jgi:hypothetical protein